MSMDFFTYLLEAHISDLSISLWASLGNVATFFSYIENDYHKQGHSVFVNSHILCIIWKQPVECPAPEKTF